MTTDEFIEKLEKAIDVDAGTIGVDDVLETSGYWDSMSNIIFIATVDQQLGLKLPASEVQKCVTVGDLLALCKSKLDA